LTCLNNLTNNTLKKYTIVIKGESKFKDVDGGSGSIMLALGVLSALYNKTINENVIATGTINPDCSISTVLGVKEKLIGVENLGYKKFYIPYQNYKVIEGMNSSIKVIPVKNLKEVLNGELK
jgi:predicted S18 family serine protease